MHNRIILVLAVLFACQLAGETISLLLHLPIPGPVIGMVILFCGLLVYGRVPDALGAVTGELLSNLSLLFVPAGVGVMLHARLLSENWLALSTALVLSTLVALTVTGLLMRWASRWTARPEAGEEQGTGAQ